MPESLQKLSTLNQWDGIIPEQLFHDLRQPKRKENDRLGIAHTTLD